MAIWPSNPELIFLSIMCHSSSLSRCYSYVGKTVKNGQVISIGAECGYLGTVEHEFLHALGLYHEQARYDRDDYVTIIWKNIRDGTMTSLSFKMFLIFILFLFYSLKVKMLEMNNDNDNNNDNELL